MKVQNNNIVENNLQKLRNERELTQKEVCLRLLANGCEISRSTYSKYETGARQIPIKILIILARCFETTTDNILGIK